MNTAAKARKKLSPTTYFRLIDISTIMFVIILAMSLILPRADIAIGLLTIFFCIMMIYVAVRGPADEFAKSCWNSGSSAAFMAVIALLLIAPFLLGFTEGVIEAFTDGYIGAHNAQIGAPPAAESRYSIGWNISTDQSTIFSIIIFFAIFQWRRHRGQGS